MANFDEAGQVIMLQLLEYDNRQNEGARRNKFYKKLEPFTELSDEAFIRLFRLSKDVVNSLINVVRPHIMCGSRKSSLDVQSKVLIALRFFASGSYQMDTACNFFLAVSQSSVSRAIHQVIDVLNMPHIFNEWVKFPRNIGELEQVRNRFFQHFQFPGVIGCIDCTHVAIFPPKVNDPQYPEAVYVNRKRYHSINVQLICDSNMRILNVNARYPGSTNDAFIWRNSGVQQLLENLHGQRHNTFYLLGDSGYPLRPWLLTPIADEPQPGTPEARYNETHKRCRGLIERCNGVLKMRFRCLLKHRVLHYDPATCSKIINACVVLHNMCVANNIPLNEDIENEVDYGRIVNDHVDVVEHNRRVDPDLVEGRNLRNRIIRNYFT